MEVQQSVFRLREVNCLKPLTLFIKAGCSTCQKAKQLLGEWQVPYTERDIFKHPLDAQELSALIQRAPLQDLFSHRSPSARSQGLDGNTQPPELLIEKMLAEPRLIRRPLLLAGDTVVIGCQPDQMREAIHAP